MQDNPANGEKEEYLMPSCITLINYNYNSKFA